MKLLVFFVSNLLFVVFSSKLALATSPTPKQNYQIQAADFVTTEQLNKEIQNINNSKYQDLVAKTDQYTNTVNMAVSFAGAFFTVAGLVFGVFSFFQSININNVRKQAEMEVVAIKKLHSGARSRLLKAKRNWRVADKAAKQLVKVNTGTNTLWKKIDLLEKDLLNNKTTPEINSIKTELEKIRKEQVRLGNKFVSSYSTLSGATLSGASIGGGPISFSQPLSGGIFSSRGSGSSGVIGAGFGGGNSDYFSSVPCSECGRIINKASSVSDANGTVFCKPCWEK